MAAERDCSEFLHEAVVEAGRTGESLCIAGSGSKAWLASGAEVGPEAFAGLFLSTIEHRGVIDYRPEELVITARSGTPLREIETLLAAAGQHLPFDPPRYRGAGTLGGAIAAGLSGPGRPWRGAVRDAVLGVELVNGLGERLRFGGQVMKNVAGYDLARLQVGAFGTLGLLLSASIKVLPVAVAERTLRFEWDAVAALRQCREWARTAYPISAACHVDGVLRIRLSGAEPAVAQAAAELGGDECLEPDFWARLRDHRLDFFRVSAPLWRVSVPPAAPTPMADCLVNWAGAERWWPESGDPAAIARLRDDVAAAGGTLRRFDGRFGCFDAGWSDGGPLAGGIFTGGSAAGDTLPAGSAKAPGFDATARLKAAFDPAGVLNPHLGPAVGERRSDTDAH